MKYTRLLQVVISLIVAILILGGCGQNGAKKGKIYTAYFQGEDVWPYNDPERYAVPDDEATIVVNGVTYTGVYQSTLAVNGITSDVFYEYTGAGFEFSINARDQKFHSLRLSPPKEKVCTLDASHGREIADAIADDFISLEDYQVIESTPHAIYNTHQYEYYREVNGIKTKDCIIIEIDCSGNLNSVVLWQLGAFENVKSVAIDEEKAKAAIEEKCREYYTDERRDFTSCEIRNSELLLVKTEANQCALHFRVAPRYQDKDSERDTGDWVQLMLVIVDYEKYDWFKP